MYLGLLRFNNRIIQLNNENLEVVLNELIAKVEYLKKRNKDYTWQMSIKKQHYGR